MSYVLVDWSHCNIFFVLLFLFYALYIYIDARVDTVHVSIDNTPKQIFCRKNAKNFVLLLKIWASIAKGLIAQTEKKNIWKRFSENIRRACVYLQSKTVLNILFIIFHKTLDFRNFQQNILISLFCTYL